MTFHRYFSTGLAACSILVLILDGQTALQGAVSGIELCIKTVIPGMFPFLYLCTVLTDMLWGCKPPFHQLCRRLGIPPGGESILVPALLGGYPAGAKVIGEAYRDGKLRKRDALHLLRFCSIAGPAFLFGMISFQFPVKSDVWALWFIQIQAAFFTGLQSRHDNESTVEFLPKARSMPNILLNTVKTMSFICGWILLFRILISFLEKWVFRFLPTVHQVMIIGLLELSNGCIHLSTIENESLRFIVCSCLLSFGGLCILMQTISVIEDLSCKSYFRGKILQSLYSILLSLCFLRFGWTALLISGILIFIYPYIF